MYPNATKKLLSETFPTSVLYWPDYIVPTSDCHIVSSPCFYIVSMSYCYIVSTSYFYIVTTSDCHIVFLIFFIKKTPFKPHFFSQFSPFCLYIEPVNIQIHFYFITNIRALTGFEPLHIFFDGSWVARLIDLATGDMPLLCNNYVRHLVTDYAPFSEY